MDDNSGLYNPMGLKEKEEYWDGFGRKEAIQTVITIISLNIFNLIVYLALKNTIFVSVFFLVSIGVSIMMYTKDFMNLSIYDRVLNKIRFNRSQKVYEYKYIDEWKEVKD